MTSFSHEALFAKSKVYIERALKHHSDSDNDGFQLWAALSLELLGKAALAHVHPVLVADPNDNAALFAACGHPFSTQLKSIQAKTVFERLTHISKKFLTREKDFCMEMANRRNAELHSGELPYVGMRLEAWMPKFWRVTKVILDAQKKSLADWIGADAAKHAEGILKKETLKVAVDSRIKKHKDEFEAKHPAASNRKKARDAVVLSRSLFLPLFGVGIDAIEWQECPACKSLAAVGGELWDEEVTDGGDPDEPWLEIVKRTYSTSAFRCVVCGLALNGREELDLAGLMSEFQTEEIREPDYEEEYGNE